MEPRTREALRDFSCEVHVLSVCGPVREENQDAGVVWRGGDGEVALIVSDGMGGHAAGREAAELVVRSCLEAVRNRTAEPWETVFASAVQAAQSAVHEAANDGPARLSMGATAALAILERTDSTRRLHVAHVGDSRVYLYRGRSLYRLTADHSLVAQMVRDGLLREDEAFGHPDSNVIQRAIGQETPLQPEIQDPIPLDAGDIVLVCSDGLHGAVPDEEIGEVIGRSAGAEEICQSLLAAALTAGSQDNVTIGCARILANRSERRPTRIHD